MASSGDRALRMVSGSAIFAAAATAIFRPRFAPQNRHAESLKNGDLTISYRHPLCAVSNPVFVYNEKRFFRAFRKRFESPSESPSGMAEPARKPTPAAPSDSE